MANVTEDGKYSTTIPEFFCTSGFETAQRIFISAIGLPLSIVAIIGNFLIIVTLRKVSFLRPPSKLLLVCLASTDLVVGLISHPLYSFNFMFPEHSKSCYYSELLFLSIGSLLCGVSLLTTTVISLDRLLALLLGLRYRQVVTVRRVRALVATFLVLFTFLAPFVFLSYRTTVGHSHNRVVSICNASFMLNDLYFLLHQNLSHTSLFSNSSAKPRSPRTTE